MEKEYKLNLSEEANLEHLRNTLREAYKASGETNINLHTTTSDHMYSSEINLTQEEGTIEEQIEEAIQFWTNPKEPTYHISIWGGELKHDIRTIEEASPSELNVIKMYEQMHGKINL